MVRYGPETGKWSYYVACEIAPSHHEAPFVGGTCAHGDDALAAGLVALARVRRRGY